MGETRKAAIPNHLLFFSHLLPEWMFFALTANCTEYHATVAAPTSPAFRHVEPSPFFGRTRRNMLTSLTKLKFLKYRLHRGKLPEYRNHKIFYKDVVHATIAPAISMIGTLKIEYFFFCCIIYQQILSLKNIQCVCWRISESMPYVNCTKERGNPNAGQESQF